MTMKRYSSLFADGKTFALTFRDGDETSTIELAHGDALDLAHAICDAMDQLKEPDVDPVAGVKLYEARKFEGRLDKKLGRHGLEEKFVLTAHGDGATEITLRLSPEKVDAFLAQMEQNAPRRKRSSDH